MDYSLSIPGNDMSARTMAKEPEECEMQYRWAG